MAPDGRKKYRIKSELARLELDQRQLDLRKEQLALDRKKLELEQKLNRAGEEEDGIVDLTMDDYEVEVKEEQIDNAEGEGERAVPSGRALETNSQPPNHDIKQDDEGPNVRPQDADQATDKMAADRASTPAREAATLVTRSPASQYRDPSHLETVRQIQSVNQTSRSGPTSTKMFVQPCINSASDQVSLQPAGGQSLSVGHRDWEMLRANKLPERVEPMTADRKQELIRHYAVLFTRSMEYQPCTRTSKTKLSEFSQEITEGSESGAYKTLADLHVRYQELLQRSRLGNHSKTLLLSKLEEFRVARQIWWAKCRTLATQAERFTLMALTVKDVDAGRFHSSDYGELHLEGKDPEESDCEGN